jgi:hypothetical protein
MTPLPDADSVEILKVTGRFATALIGEHGLRESKYYQGRLSLFVQSLVRAIEPSGESAFHSPRLQML